MDALKVRLHTIEDVRMFVTAANMQVSDIDVVSGRYTIDAKSLLGIFSLDLTKRFQWLYTVMRLTGSALQSR
jgi:hypothetical protein